MTLARAAAHCMALMLMLSCSHIALAQNAELDQVQKLAQSGELDRASEQIESYVKAHPKDPRGRFLQGVVLGRQDKVDEAIAVYRALTYDYPELPEPYNNLAALLAEKGEYEQARAALEMAVRARPGYATAHENLGDIYLKLAAMSYARAVALDRNSATAQKKLKVVNDLVPATPLAAGDKAPGR